MESSKLAIESSVASSALYGNRLKKQSKPVCFPDGTKQNDEHCDLRSGSGCSVCKYGHYWWWIATYCCKQDTSRECKCHSSEDEVAAAVSSMESSKLAIESSVASSALYGNRLKKQSKPVCFPDGTKQNDEHCDLRSGSGCSVCKYGHYWWWIATYCCKQDTSRECKCHSSED